MRIASWRRLRLNSGVNRTSRGEGVSGSFGINAVPESVHRVSH